MYNSPIVYSEEGRRRKEALRAGKNKLAGCKECWLKWNLAMEHPENHAEAKTRFYNGLTGAGLRRKGIDK